MSATTALSEEALPSLDGFRCRAEPVAGPRGWAEERSDGAQRPERRDSLPARAAIGALALDPGSRKAALQALLRAKKLEREAPPLRGDDLRPRRLLSGLPEIDRVAGGGLPRGAVSECFGPASSGRTGTALVFAAHATHARRAGHLGRPGDRLDPTSRPAPASTSIACCGCAAADGGRARSTAAQAAQALGAGRAGQLGPVRPGRARPRRRVGGGDATPARNELGSRKLGRVNWATDSERGAAVAASTSRSAQVWRYHRAVRPALGNSRPGRLLRGLDAPASRACRSAVVPTSPPQRRLKRRRCSRRCTRPGTVRAKKSVSTRAFTPRVEAQRGRPRRALARGARPAVERTRPSWAARCSRTRPAAGFADARVAIAQPHRRCTLARRRRA